MIEYTLQLIHTIILVIYLKNKTFKLEIIGFIFVSILGTLFHFAFDFFDRDTFFASFFPVNESIWEHLKLLFFPFSIYSIIEFFCSFKEKKNFIPAKIIGVILGMILITSFYYTYSGAFGKSIDFLNILSFFLGNLFAFLTSYVIINSSRLKSKNSNIVAVSLFLVIALIFGVFTFNPPYIPLFKDPIQNYFGI